MRFRSTGLGPSELRGEMIDVSPVGKDLLVLQIQTREPVKWEMKAGVERQDIAKILKEFLKPSILFFALRCLIYLRKAPSEPEDLMGKSISEPARRGGGV